MELSRGGSLGGLSFDLSLTPDDPLEPEPETLKRHSGRCKINLFSDEKKHHDLCPLFVRKPGELMTANALSILFFVVMRNYDN